MIISLHPHFPLGQYCLKCQKNDINKNQPGNCIADGMFKNMTCKSKNYVTKDERTGYLIAHVSSYKSLTKGVIAFFIATLILKYTNN